MVLTNFAVRQAKATGKPYTLNDTEALSLAVSSSGGKCWHFRYYWMGERKRMSLGTYPEVSLREARELRDEARALVVKGVNPRAHRKQKRAAVKLAGENDFKLVFDRWHAHRSLSLKKGRQTALSQVERVFAKDVLPKLGHRSIYEIKRQDLLDVLGAIERREACSVAKKVRSWFNQMFRYALVKVDGLEINPASDLDVVAKPAPPVRHQPFLRLGEVPECLRMLRTYPGRLQTQLGLRMLFLTGVRTGELRWATPDQFHLDRGLWIIPPDVVKQLQTKMQRERIREQDIPPYIVPLPVQAQEIVRHLLNEFQPAQVRLIPSDWSPRKPISENTLNHALHRMGFKDRLTGHGIRATIATALNEIGYPKIWVDAQLSHADPDKVSSAYNHAEYVEQRRRMMQDWADRLDLLEQGKVEQANSRLIVSPATVQPLSPDSGTGVSFVVAEVPPVASDPQPVVAATQPPGEAAHPVVVRLPAVRLPTDTLQADLSEEQRARLERLEIFNSPRTLPADAFAKAVGKSRRAVSYNIQMGKLLALTMGNRGVRVPDWHLDPVKHHLIQAVLKYAGDTDPWLIYEALSEPHPMLDNRAPIDAATRSSIHEAAMAACFKLGEADPIIAAAG